MVEELVEQPVRHAIWRADEKDWFLRNTADVSRNVDVSKTYSLCPKKCVLLQLLTLMRIRTQVWLPEGVRFVIVVSDELSHRRCFS